jgi:prepilin-type N-terminal cleavage/methylation domain-containing protein
MNKRQKSGFTLIELMLVIMILSILAAIALPKMFAISAKAKAADLAPAKGTWRKMQEAYYLETRQHGTFMSIGFAVPASNSFTFEDTGTDTTTGLFIAKNYVGLAECAANTGVWQASIIANVIVPNVEGGSPCATLAPSFNTGN